MILDTNAVSALSIEDQALLALLDRSSMLHLPVIVIGEYEFGMPVRSIVASWQPGFH